MSREGSEVFKIEGVNEALENYSLTLERRDGLKIDSFIHGKMKYIFINQSINGGLVINVTTVLVILIDKFQAHSRACKSPIFEGYS